MNKENLPLELVNKHLPSLGLIDPLYIDSEKDLLNTERPVAQSAVVFLPKSKALIDMTLALVTGMVEEGGKIILAGSNDAGIRSAKDAFEKNIGPVEQKIVGNHSALYVGMNRKLAGSKKPEDYLTFSPISYKDIILVAANLPGVFSAGELDAGTKLLLDTIPFDKKKILDIGCGAGVIGSIYKMRNEKCEVTMSDNSPLATLATSKTLDANQIKAKIIESDVFSNISDKFDLILCNPPFHKGVSTDYSFIETFAKDAKKFLNPGGEIYIVCNSFLPYQDILQRKTGATEVLADNKKFKVVRCK
jgi:16S rRNA (guanine1207-N2)-methyltransferase